MIEIKSVKSKRSKRKRKKVTGMYWKVLIAIIVAHGMACVSMSYILAWTYHTDVVETVSSTIVNEIIAPLLAGLLSKTVENVFEKNELSFSKPIAKAQTSESAEEESVG